MIWDLLKIYFELRLKYCGFNVFTGETEFARAHFSFFPTSDPLTCGYVARSSLCYQ